MKILKTREARDDAAAEEDEVPNIFMSFLALTELKL
jgi:hypothetical protein